MSRSLLKALASLFIVSLAAVLAVVMVTKEWGTRDDLPHAPVRGGGVSTPGWHRSALGMLKPYALTESLERGGVQYRADRSVPLGRLADHVDTAGELMADWAGFALDEGVPPVRYVYLCRLVETLLAIERHHDFKSIYQSLDSSKTKGRTFEPRGGYYKPLSLVILLDRPGSDAEWDVPHEIVHSIVEVAGRDVASVLNEGLAELLAPAALYAKGARPGDPLPLDLDVAWRSCEELDRISRPGVLSRLFALDYWSFRDAKVENLYYELSTSLVHLLLTHEHPALEGRFPVLISRLRRYPDTWDAFRKTYPPALVERLWVERVKEWRKLPWKKAFGRNWILHGTDLIARQHIRGGSALLRTEPLGEDGFRLTFSWDELPGEAATAGFVVSDGSPLSSIVFGFENGDLIRAQSLVSEWKLQATLPKPDGLDRMAEWSLEWNPSDEEIVWRIGDEIIHRESGIDPGQHLGLFFESRLEQDEAGVRDIRFRNVELTR
ncbi:MAG: hypothetical protein RL885_33470 [Planctomycetota bacterium]